MNYPKDEYKKVMKEALLLSKESKTTDYESYLESHFDSKLLPLYPNLEYKKFRENFTECALELIQENFSDEYVERLMKSWENNPKYEELL